MKKNVLNKLAGKSSKARVENPNKLAGKSSKARVENPNKLAGKSSKARVENPSKLAGKSSKARVENPNKLAGKSSKARVENSKNETLVIILAGGVGERFWPKSKKSHPKQLHKIYSSNTLLEETLIRARSITDKKNIYIACNPSLAKLIIKTNKSLTISNFILEPVGRNTAPIIVLIALKFKNKNPNTVLVILSSDHYIAPLSKFKTSIDEAIKMARMGKLVTLGVKPTRVETQYGYIEIDNENTGHANNADFSKNVDVAYNAGFSKNVDVANNADLSENLTKINNADLSKSSANLNNADFSKNVDVANNARFSKNTGHANNADLSKNSANLNNAGYNSRTEKQTWKNIISFKEKPDLNLAQKYFNSENFLWNSGIFIWNIGTILKEFEQNAKEIIEPLKKIYDSQSKLNNGFIKIPNTPIDIAILEKTKNLIVIPATFQWDDLGSWNSLERILPKDKNGNIFITNNSNNSNKARLVELNSSENIIVKDSGLVALLGVKNMVIVQVEDILFVAERTNLDQIKKLLELIKANPTLQKYLN